jgi:hypothetical protein
MMHHLQEYTKGPPCLFFEKECLTGVHFHERLLSESGMTTAAIPEWQQQKKPRNGGTGVYFENSELTPTEGCLHPLHHHDTNHKPYALSSMMMPPVPCPLGQPLFAPPILATTLQLLDEQEQQQAQPTPFLAGRLSYDPGALQLPVMSKDCSGDLFCEIKRTAMRQKLHSRDYRLSTDELTFVEAAVKLSKGCAGPPTELTDLPAHATKTLSKPALPHYVIGYTSFEAAAVNTMPYFRQNVVNGDGNQALCFAPTTRDM